jgi:hypothetical protein
VPADPDRPDHETLIVGIATLNDAIAALSDPAPSRPEMPPGCRLDADSIDAIIEATDSLLDALTRMRRPGA